jgi:hypothetical protein
VRRFRLLCLLGFIISLIVWVLPDSIKPYHIKRALDDYKILLVEQDSEWGFASNGLVKVRTSLALAGTRAQLAPIRQEWIHNIFGSKEHWPTSSVRLHYDEWGPSHTTRDDGVETTQVGSVYCVPYSIFAIIFGLPLLWHAIFRRPLVDVKI